VLDVAIVVYRSWEHTRSCLEHLRRQTVPHRVHVCDNGCDEGSSERIRAHFPEVTLRRIERNGPYATALNAAVASGREPIVVVMNNDIDARPDYLERLQAPLMADSRLGSVAALLLRPGERQIDSAGLVADRTLSSFPRLKGRSPGEARDGRLVLTGPDSATAAFRRVAWEKVNGMDDSIHGYMDDFDLILRLRVAGWETALAADAVAVHFGSATYGHRSAEQRRKAGFGRAYMLRRYGVLRTRVAPRALAAEALVVLGDMLLQRDAAALAGRVAGWRAAREHSPRSWPPGEAIDERIGLLASMRLRWGVYAGPAKPAQPARTPSTSIRST
jgi:GT2 family glycosyltransferase